MNAKKLLLDTKPSTIITVNGVNAINIMHITELLLYWYIATYKPNYPAGVSIYSKTKTPHLTFKLTKNLLSSFEYFVDKKLRLFTDILKFQNHHIM